MEVIKAFKHSSKDVRAHLLVDFAAILAQHVRDCADLHEFKEHPEALLVVIGVNAFQNTVIILTHHHDANFIFDFIIVIHRFGLKELQCKQLLITLPFCFKYETKTTFVNSTYYLIYFTWVFLFEYRVLYELQLFPICRQFIFVLSLEYVCFEHTLNYFLWVLHYFIF